MRDEVKSADSELQHLREQLEEEVLKRTRALRTLIEASLDPLVTISPEGTITDVNRATEEITGVPRNELIGTDFSEYFTEPDRAREGYQLVFSQGRVVDYPLTIRHRSGSEADVLYNASVYRDEEGNIAGVFAAARDVTETKRAHLQVARLAAIVITSQDAIFTKTRDDIVTSWNPAAEELYGYSAEEMIGADVVVLMAPGHEDEAGQLTNRVFAGERISGFESVRRRKDGTLFEMSLSLSPILDEGGSIVAASVVGHDISKRKQAERERHQFEAKLAAAYIASPDLMSITRLSDGMILEVNAGYERLLGYERSESVGRTTSELATWVSVEDRARFLAALKASGEVENFETVFRRKDGSTVVVVESARTLTLEGEECALSVAHDVTAVKAAEEALRVASAYHRSLIEASLDPLVTISPEGTITDVNRATEEITGVPRNELIGTDFSEYFTEPDRAREGYRLVFSQGRVVDYPLTIRHRSGSEADVLYNASVYRDEEGNIAGVFAAARDVTERRRAEEELSASQRKLALHLQQTLLGVVEWDEQFRVREWNPAAEAIFGYRRDEAVGHIARELILTDPLDRKVESEWEGFLQQKGDQFPAKASRTKDGRTILCEWVNTPLTDAGGTAVGIMSLARDITERENAEAELVRVNDELRRSTALFNEAQGIAHLGSWELDVVDNVLSWSDEIYRMFEIDPTKFGASYEAFLGAIHPDDRVAVNAAYTRSLETKAPYTISHRLLFPDGRVKFVHEACETFYDEDGQPIRSVGTVQDVTERRLAEKALRDSQRKLALHLEQTLLGVIEWDTEFRVRTWNPAAEAIFGFSSEEAVGRHASELIVPRGGRPEVETIWGTLMRQEGGQFVTNENVTKDGTTIVCEWVNTPLTDEDGAVVGVMSLARDITERRQAEQLRIAKETAEAASVAKSSFLANMSHEIRTPMNAILGFSQLMRREHGLSPRQRQQLDIIAGSGEHLLALVNDVLEMSRIEAGRISANPTVFNLHVLLDEMGSLFGMRAQAKGLELRIVHGDEVPRFVVTDENKLRQILVNLLGNAVKFTEEGSVELNVTVEPRAEGEPHLIAEVKDTGRGIAPEDQDRLFENFEQVASSGEVSAGTGLGLAISREFVHLLGGEISVRSEPGVGSVFRFDIAIKEAEAGAARGRAQERHVAGLSPGEPHYRILVADDAPDNRELLIQLLEPVGFNVRAVSDGAEALNEFVDWHPHLILMDMRMPVMDGYEATRRIRSMPGGADLGIVGVTASAFAEMRQGVFDAGVDEFIVKPFHESELFDKIGALLDLHYVYEEEAESTGREVVDGLDAARLADLPAELITRLRQATITADFDAVLELAEEIGQHDEQTGAVLRVLAERFDAERIMAALRGGGS